MDIVKVFVEDPTASAGGSPPGAGNGARRALADASAEAFLERVRAPVLPVARVYLAGTRLGDDRPRVGLTALEAPDAFTEPLLTWAAARTWTSLSAGGRAEAIFDHEARRALADPNGTLLLALAPGPIPADILATIALGDASLSAQALCTFLMADTGAAVLRPAPAHDGHDWVIDARSPLRAGLVAAFRACPAPADVRRFVVPHVRGEAKFYFEQWGLETPPAGTEEL